MNGVGMQLDPARLRRIEECSLNASGAFDSLFYDGWLVGYRAGPTKRLRCVNSLHRSSLPLADKIDYCTGFYRAAGLPPLFRLLPFSEPPELDAALDRAGFERFERTLVQHVDFASLAAPEVPRAEVAVVPVPEWVEATADLLDVTVAARAGLRERAAQYPLPQAGVLVARDGVVVACGLLKLERDVAGLFALKTAPAHAGQGLGRAVVAALLAEARRRGAGRAYLQVTAANAAAVALYAHFGFATAYDYWYRGLSA
jgi:GNAT superfamily N-acetyltransferase